MGAGGLYHSKSFEDGLLTIVNMGGDADTNGAVACSLLGARYGDSAIPVIYQNPPMYKLPDLPSEEDVVNHLRYRYSFEGKQMMLRTTTVQLFDVVIRDIVPNYHLLIKEAYKEADKRLEKARNRGQMGFCHTYWREIAAIAKEKYGIIWLSPAQLNPDTCYD